MRTATSEPPPIKMSVSTKTRSELNTVSLKVNNSSLLNLSDSQDSVKKIMTYSLWKTELEVDSSGMVGQSHFDNNKQTDVFEDRCDY